MKCSMQISREERILNGFQFFDFLHIRFENLIFWFIEKMRKENITNLVIINNKKNVKS